MSYCYLNGEILEYKDCTLHISDLLIQRNYGVFDFFRCRNGSIPWLNDYLDRLFNSMRLAYLKAGISREEIISIIEELQEKNGDPNGAFKIIVTGGYSDNLEAVTGTSNVIILNVPWKKPPQESIEHGIGLISDSYVRPNPEIKSLYYLNSLKQHQKMREFNAVDVLYHQEMISETSRANVFFVSDGKIYTPLSNILPGIIRKQILAQYPEIIVEDLSFDRLYDFDEMFISSTSKDITPVVRVDGRKIGDGKPGWLTRELLAVSCLNSPA